MKVSVRYTNSNAWTELQYAITIVIVKRGETSLYVFSRIWMNMSAVFVLVLHIT